MRKLGLLLDFVRFSVHEKIVFFRKVVTDMTDNPSFTKPDVPLTEATDAVNQLERDYINSENGGKAATAAMHETERKATEIFRKLANYVDRVADGDEVIILSSGFNTTKERAAAKKVEFSVSSGEKSGTVLLKRQAIKGARSYLWQYCTNETPSDDNGWMFAGVSTRATYEINRLAPATRYWFRVAGVTSTGTTEFCSPISRIIQ